MGHFKTFSYMATTLTDRKEVRKTARVRSRQESYQATAVRHAQLHDCHDNGPRDIVGMTDSKRSNKDLHFDKLQHVKIMCQRQEVDTFSHPGPI